MRLLMCSIIVLVFVILGGCATITKGRDQRVAINTPGVQGAVCELTSEGIGTYTVLTPNNIELPKSRRNIDVMCRKECFEDTGGVINSSLVGAFAGNIILGGVIGIGVDAMSGAMNEYDPSITVYMKPIPGCLPKPG